MYNAHILILLYPAYITAGGIFTSVEYKVYM